MEVLPDIVAPAPSVVFCGLAGAESTRVREHYYASPGNSFWESLHVSGMSPRRLRADEDHLMARMGIGLTDLVGRWDPPRVEIDDLVAKVERWAPDWLAFTSKGVAHEASRALGRRGRPALGVQDWYVGPARVFVLPGTSGANQRKDYDGRPHRLAWWRDLAALSTGRDGARDRSGADGAGADHEIDGR